MYQVIRSDLSKASSPQPLIRLYREVRAVYFVG